MLDQYAGSVVDMQYQQRKGYSMSEQVTTIRVSAASERGARDIALRLGHYVYNVVQVGYDVWEVTYS